MTARRAKSPSSSSTAARIDAARLEEAWEAFVRFLKSRGARITEARRIVLEGALSRPDHFQADALAAELATRESPVSRGTVYRTLALLVRAGLLRQMRDADAHMHYEPTTGNRHHEHMVCDACGAFIEFEDAEIFRRIEKACRRKGFRQHNHRLTVFGLCGPCAREAASDHPVQENRS